MKKKSFFPSLKKSTEALKENGHLAIYISDYSSFTYVKDMKNYIKRKLKLTYLGTINWVSVDGSKIIRSIFVWKK